MGVEQGGGRELGDFGLTWRSLSQSSGVVLKCILPFLHQGSGVRARICSVQDFWMLPLCAPRRAPSRAPLACNGVQKLFLCLDLFCSVRQRMSLFLFFAMVEFSVLAASKVFANRARKSPDATPSELRCSDSIWIFYFCVDRVV